MNCDLILTEESCRFCLGETGETGTNISQESYFYVEKRLVQCKEIFNFLELRLDENHSPHVPRNICQDCKKTIVTFYGLRKNFLDNEAVLMGKLPASDNPVKTTLLKNIEMFLKEHENCLEQLTIKKYPDQLVIQKENSPR